MYTYSFDILNLSETYSIWTSPFEYFLILNLSRIHLQCELHPILLKSCAETLAMPSSMMFQVSYNKGQLSTDWKKAEVIPIDKKGPKIDPGNYRPPAGLANVHPM